MGALAKVKKLVEKRDKQAGEPPSKAFESRALPRHKFLACLNWSRPLLRAGAQLLNTRSAQVIEHLNDTLLEGKGVQNEEPGYIT